MVEEAGITTVCVSTGRDLTEQVMPPRSIFVNHPMGNAFGKPGDKAMQIRVLRAALDLAVSASESGELVDLPVSWPGGVDYNPGAYQS